MLRPRPMIKTTGRPADTVARVQTEVATTIIEGAIDTLKDDDTLKEAFMEAVDARAAALASHAHCDAAREALAADAERAHEAEVAERAARESERAAGFSLLSSQLADLGSLMSGILGRNDADVAAAFPEPRPCPRTTETRPSSTRRRRRATWPLV